MDHKELDVWKKSIGLVELVYSITFSFPKSEQFGLTSQMRRAAISISSNIAEGSARKGNKELLQFFKYCSCFTCRIGNPIYNCHKVSFCLTE